MMAADASGLGGMFLAAFTAATPIPMQSELVFVALATAGWPLTALVVVASLGNVLGSCVTYAVGRGIGGAGSNHGRLGRWFGIAPDKLAKAESWFTRWGRWSLLLSWAPGGDILVALAGMLRMPLVVFLPLLTLAKTGRYILVACITSAVL